MPAEIAVVVGNHQGERLLRDCLESVHAQTRAPSAIVVVDGGSTDRSVEVAEELGASVLRAENRGLGFLYNLGARMVEAEYVLLSNNDVAYEADCLAHLADALDAEPHRFAADPTQLAWDDGRVIHARTRLARGRLWREHLPGLDAALCDDVIASEDAFDAAVTAVVMSRCEDELRHLPTLPDPTLRREGWVWSPDVTPSVRGAPVRWG